MFVPAFWLELWIRLAMAPLESVPFTEPLRAVPSKTAEYLIRELQEDLERQGPQDVIDEGGERAKWLELKDGSTD